MECYLCHSSCFSTRKGSVRDLSDLKILECKNCGLVTLSSIEHIKDNFYESSGMHGDVIAPIESWLKDTDWDDRRRFEMVRSILPNKRLLDFGCGAGGFLLRAQNLAANAVGVEPESRVLEHWKKKLKLVSNIDAAGGEFDLITAFHVVEHLADPRAVLEDLSKLLKPSGQMIIEVPNAEDALLTLYDCSAFQNFTYWSQHLFLFNPETLQKLALQAGLKVVSIQCYQRYPLSNHLYWLSKGQPAGHRHWGFLDTPETSDAYARALEAVGKTDTLIAYLEASD
jgi:2-polyprenyl-3-methyl-5-hydroxy-6-metoxy-1,4-benzoquinol methylase